MHVLKYPGSLILFQALLEEVTCSGKQQELAAGLCSCSRTRAVLHPARLCLTVTRGLWGKGSSKTQSIWNKTKSLGCSAHELVGSLELGDAFAWCDLRKLIPSLGIPNISLFLEDAQHSAHSGLAPTTVQAGHTSVLVQGVPVLEKCLGRAGSCISFLLSLSFWRSCQEKLLFVPMYTLKFFSQGFYVAFNWKLFGTFQFIFVLTRVFGLRSIFLQSSYYSFTFYQLKSLNLNVIIPGGGGETDGWLEIEIMKVIICGCFLWSHFNPSLLYFPCLSNLGGVS